MTPSGASTEATNAYAFRFDSPIEPIVVGGELDVAGWLLHRTGKPVYGLRAIVKRRFFSPAIVRGRRKRKRLDVAAAFPHLPEAEASGFLLELRLRFGRNRLTFQVLDHDRVWRTFSSAVVSSLPLTILQRSGLTNVRRFLIFYLGNHLGARQPSFPEAVPPAAIPPSDFPLATKRVDLFATSKSNLFIVEIGELVAAGFRELGCDAQMHLDKFPAENPPVETLQIVVTPHEFYNLFLTEQMPRAQAQLLTRNVYLLCTEQPETGWFQSNLQWGAHSLGVADIHPLGVAAYRTRGLKSRQLQLGYHPILSQQPRKPHRARMHDITFLGSITDRRDRFFAEHSDFFASRRCHLRLVPLGFAKTKETRSYLSAERRNELLNDSRILLNVHYSEQKYFEWHRMLVGLANGCCIISENCHGHGPLVPGQHFIMVEPEYLITACEYYLEHPDECEAIACAGLKFIETHLRQAQTCRAFLESIERDFMPASPLDSAAVPLPAELRHRFSRHTGHLLSSAVKRDLRSLLHKRADQREVFPQSSGASEISEQRTRATVIEKRNAYKKRLDQQGEMDARGESIWQFHDNDAFARCAAPKLSVLITLYNYGHHIDECIASIACAAERLAEPPELVIVNDASSDDSLARALHYQRNSPLPVRVVDKKFNTGLANARNVGTQIARAPYIFMMDADNLILPEGFKQLLKTISDGNYDAAYSLLCRFRGTPTNRVGLLSYFDWDPQILVQFPYIDAMAIFRREALLALGGYDNQLSQIGWFGWEDYDMWLKFAQHDYRVTFVPNTLCLYRHHETSMINTTTLFQAELAQHFMVRYGELVDRFEPRETLFGVVREEVA